MTSPRTCARKVSNVRVIMPIPSSRPAAVGASLELFGGLGADLDLLAGRLEALGTDLQIETRLVDRLQRILERQVAVLQKLQLLVELLQRLLVRQLLAHPSTCSTRAPSRPVANRMRSLRSTAVSVADRTTRPDSASIVML